jgi:two-component system response regulator RpfG
LGSDAKLGSTLQAIFSVRLRAALDVRDIAATAEGRATALANRLGRSVSTAARWLNGEMLPGLDTLSAIATAYGVSLDYLLGLSKQDRGLEESGTYARAETPRDPQPILIVDDQATARRILHEIAVQADPQTKPVVFGGAPEALRWASAYNADLVVTDFRLPGMDGLEFVRGLRRLSHFAEVPVLMVTVVEERDLRRRALQQGINDFLQKPIDPPEGTARCRNLLAISRQQALLRDRTSLLAGLVEARTSHLKGRAREALLLLATLVEGRNGADANHAARIGAVSGLLAREAGLPAEAVEAIELGAALHDVGTLALPERVLGGVGDTGTGHAPGFEAHTTLGYRLLKGHESEPVRAAALIALGHHEWFDGRGYPTGLSGDHIQLAARITAVADRLDTLRLDAVEAGWAEIWARLVAERSSRLDPALVDALVEVSGQVEDIYRRLPPDLPAAGRE